MNSKELLHNISEEWRFCLAPMMKKTDRHFRYLVSIIAPKMRLYTEMITPNAIIHGNRARFLGHSREEQPLALQLGSADPLALLQSALLAVEAGFKEINLNCGCPSDRVQSGSFGAAMMKVPTVVAHCVSTLRAELPSNIQISVKTRLGVDDLYSYDYLHSFISQIHSSGCRVFHIHARQALLAGLSPKENREIPPLNHEWVYRIKKDFPMCTVVLNGGVNSACQLAGHLQHVDGVMIGRHAYNNPFDLAQFEKTIFDQETNAKALTRRDVVLKYLDYADKQISKGFQFKAMVGHLINMYQGQPNAKGWRRYLSVNSGQGKTSPETVLSALTLVN
jgi:tRNA-dihydrouridine synthase A